VFQEGRGQLGQEIVRREEHFSLGGNLLVLNSIFSQSQDVLFDKSSLSSWHCKPRIEQNTQPPLLIVRLYPSSPFSIEALCSMSSFRRWNSPHQISTRLKINYPEQAASLVFSYRLFQSVYTTRFWAISTNASFGTSFSSRVKPATLSRKLPKLKILKSNLDTKHSSP
jgi:hypothetical protein